MLDLEEAVTHRDRSDWGGEAGPPTQPQVKAECTEKGTVPARKESTSGGGKFFLRNASLHLHNHTSRWELSFPYN